MGKLKPLNDVPFFHKLFGTTPNDDNMQPKEAIAYSITGFGQNLICTVIGSYLTVFMTDAIGFGMGMNVGTVTGLLAVALLMLGTRVFDALNDPIMGSIVDRTRTKWGKCRPYLKWMAIPIGVVTVLCFLPWYPQNSGGFAAIAIVYVIWSMVYTVADVPYWGLSTAMTNNTEIRGKMLTVARLVCTAGAGLVTIAVPPITKALTNKYTYGATHEFSLKTPSGVNIFNEEAAGFFEQARNGNYTLIKSYQEQGYRDISGIIDTANAAAAQEVLRMAYFVIALILVVVAIPMFYYGFKNTKERFSTAENVAPPSLGHNLKLLFKNKQLMLIVLSGVLGGARMVYTYTGGLYFCKYALQNEALYSTLTLLVIPGGLAASVMVPWLTKKIGKKWSFIGSHIIGAVAMVIMFFMWDFGTASFRNGGMAVTIICLIFIGIPQGISNIVTYAMIGDTVDYLEWKTGERGEGICFAMQTLINKIGMAIGAFIGVLSFIMAGIDVNDVATSLDKNKLNDMWMMLVLSGVVSFIACIIPMFFYNLTEKRQGEMVAEIAERKAAAEAGIALKTANETANV